MTAPILMLVLLTSPYAICRLLKTFTKRNFDPREPAAVGLALLFVMTGIGHFTDTQTMAQMLPSWIPARVTIIYLTGILEFLIAAGFLFQKWRPLTGWVTAIMLLTFFPANIYAAIHHVPQGGHIWGPIYLLIRAPLQLIILAWVYWFTIKARGPAPKANNR